MKKALGILLIVVLGIALGVGVAMLRVKTSPWNPALDEGKTADGASKTGGEKAEKKVGQLGRATASAFAA